MVVNLLSKHLFFARLPVREIRYLLHDYFEIERKNRKGILNDFTSMSMDDISSKYMRDLNNEPCKYREQIRDSTFNHMMKRVPQDKDLIGVTQHRLGHDLNKYSIVAERKMAAIHSKFDAGEITKAETMKQLRRALRVRRKSDRMAVKTRHAQAQQGLIIRDASRRGIEYLVFTIVGPTCNHCQAMEGKRCSVTDLDPLSPNIQNALGFDTKQEYLKSLK